MFFILLIAASLLLALVLMLMLLLARCSWMRSLFRLAAVVGFVILVVGGVALLARVGAQTRVQMNNPELPERGAAPDRVTRAAAPAPKEAMLGEGPSIALDARPSKADPASPGSSDYSVVYIDYDRRPDWVESAPVVDTSGVDRIAVSSGPWVLRRESLRALDEEVQLAAQQYINDYLETDAAARLLRYDLKEIKRRLIKPGHTFEETIAVSVGPMQQTHALLEFDEPFRRELDQRWNRIVATSRLLQTGLGALGILGLLGLALAYLRLDTATRGYYTRRLQWGAAMAILMLIVAGAVLARWIPWV